MVPVVRQEDTIRALNIHVLLPLLVVGALPTAGPRVVIIRLLFCLKNVNLKLKYQLVLKFDFSISPTVGGCELGGLRSSSLRLELKLHELPTH